MSRSLVRVAVVCALGACSDPATNQAYTVVTIDGVPAVHDVNVLRVTLSNAGSERTDELAFNGTFPFTFSVSAPDREGVLGIQVDALDDNDFVVGQGSSMSTVDAPTAQVMLDSTDFVVNTDVAGDQFPSDDFEAHGFQVAADASGLWTVGFRDSCSTPCNMFARRFDVTGAPASTRVAAGTNAFPVSTELTSSFFNTTAVAVAGPATLVVWGFSEPAPSTIDGIACRSLDTQGNATPSQLEIPNETNAEVVSIAPLSNQNFVIAWNASVTATTIRSAIVRADCTVLTGPTSVSTVANPRKASVTSHPTANKILYAWIVASSIHVRIASLTNVFEIVDTEFLPAGTDPVEFVRVAPLGSGFAIVARHPSGHIDLYRTNAAGAVMGSPTVVSMNAGTDFMSTEAFGVAGNAATDQVFVTWQACDTNGDGQGCGIFGRVINADGSPATPELTIPTTTVGDQTNPSVTSLPNNAWAVVWRDDSAQAPDTSGSAVRARIVYTGNLGN